MGVPGFPAAGLKDGAWGEIDAPDGFEASLTTLGADGGAVADALGVGAEDAAGLKDAVGGTVGEGPV